MVKSYPFGFHPYFVSGQSAAASRQFPAQPMMPMQPMQPMPGMMPVTPSMPAGATIPGIPIPGAQFPITMEESFVENVLRLNLGKMATVYMTFENNSQWNAKIFRGRLEAAAKDHLILSDPKTGKRYFLLMVNLDYIEFDEPLKYFLPTQVPEQITTQTR
jgi:spore germination protein Q